MKTALVILISMSVLGAGILGTCVIGSALENANKRKLQKSILSRAKDASKDADISPKGSWNIRYLEQLTQELFCGVTQPIDLRVRSKRSANTLAGSWYEKHSAWAGCAHTVSSSAFCEAALRLALFGCLFGGVLGIVFSLPFALLLALFGFAFGYTLPFSAVRHAIKERSIEAELHLSEMLQIVSLGLRSGLTFDRSFALYGRYFENNFSRSCAFAYRKWSLGLSSREESLEEFAASYKCEQLARATESILRSLRFGSSLAPLLEETSAQARATYRACLEERVAKAPVKMMLPTGTLILPAMLLLVLGPVLLELIQGF